MGYFGVFLSIFGRTSTPNDWKQVENKFQRLGDVSFCALCSWPVWGCLASLRRGLHMSETEDDELDDVVSTSSDEGSDCGAKRPRKCHPRKRDDRAVGSKRKRDLTPTTVRFNQLRDFVHDFAPVGECSMCVAFVFVPQRSAKRDGRETTPVRGRTVKRGRGRPRSARIQRSNDALRREMGRQAEKSRAKARLSRFRQKVTDCAPPDDPVNAADVRDSEYTLGDVEYPLPAQFDGFNDPEHIVQHAIGLSYLNAGVGDFTTDIPTRTDDVGNAHHDLDEAALSADLKQLAEAIASRVVTNTQKQHCFARCTQAINKAMPLLGCGSCGERKWAEDVHGNAEFNRVLLTQLQLLKLTEEQCKRHTAMLNHSIIASVTVFQGELYHLHPELVYADTTVGTEYDTWTWLCLECFNSVTANTIPPLSLAAGLDYGWLRRANPAFPDLTPVERALLSPVRLYMTIFKLKRCEGLTDLSRQKGLTAHCIAFDDGGIQEMATRLPCVDDLHSRFVVEFVGPKNEFERNSKVLLGLDKLQARWDVIVAYLQLFRAVNPMLATVIDLSDAVKARIEHVTQELLEKALVVSDDRVLNMEKKLDATHPGRQGVAYHDSNINSDAGTDATTSCDDPAQVDIDANDTPGCDNAPQHATVEHVFVSNDVDTIGNGVRMAGTRVLKGIAHEIGINASSQHDGDDDNDVGNDDTTDNACDNVTQPPLKVQRSATPVNELVFNDKLFYGAFPDVFLLGRGLGDHHAYFPERLILHMLRQFTGVFAEDSRLLFALFDQKRRQAVMQSVRTRVNASPEAFAAFMRAVEDPEFAAKLREALHNPDSKEYRELIETIIPHIRIVGRQVPYSPMERQHAAAELHGMVHRFGLPSVFLTISPDDVYSPMVLRMCVPPPTLGQASPIEDLDAFLRGMAGEKTEVVLGGHVLSRDEVTAKAANNPVACAELFHRTMVSVFKHLLGVEPAHTTRKTMRRGARGGGVFGDVTAVYAVCEAQNRGSLHMHMAIWGGVPPNVLQAVAACPALCAQVGTALDSMFTATLPVDEHLRGMFRRIDHIGAPHYAARTCVGPDDDLAAFQTHVWRSVDASCLHIEHGEHCAAGGKVKCGAAKPSGLVPHTRPVVLSCVRDELAGYTEDGQLKERVVASEDIPDASAHRRGARFRDVYTCPVPPKDERLVFWELERPSIEVEVDTDGFVCDKRLSAEHTQRLNAMSTEDRKHILDVLRGRNGRVVEYNDVITGVLSCNTAAYILGSTEQAKSVLYYLVDYMTKNPVKLHNILSVIGEARVHNAKYPSTAPDKDTQQRRAMYLLQRVLNRLTGMTEVSSQQAAAYLLGMPSAITTTPFRYVFVKAALDRVLATSGSVGSTTGEANKQSTDETNEPPVLIGNHGTATPLQREQEMKTVLADAANGGGSGTAPLYAVGKQLISVPQDVSYALRGSELKDLALWEYVMLISIVKKTAAATQNDGHGGPQQGRRNNTRFPFHPDHPLYSTHVQVLVSKHATPIISGMRVPKCPDPVTDTDRNPAWQRQADAFAAFMLTLFKPWNTITLSPGPLTWEAFCAYMAELEGVGPKKRTFIGYCRARTIENITHALHTTSHRAWMTASYRARDAEPLFGYKWFTDATEDSLQRIAGSTAVAMIDKIQEQAEMLTARQTERMLTVDNYVATTVKTLDRLFGDTDCCEDGCAGFQDGVTENPIQSRAVIRSGVYQPPPRHRVDGVLRAMREARASVAFSNTHNAVTEPADGEDLRDHGGAGSSGGNGRVGDSKRNNDAFIRSLMTPGLVLSDEQYAGFRTIVQYVLDVQHYKRYPEQHRDQQPQLKLLVHGGAGVGKTTMIKEVHQALTKLGSGIRCTAYMGVAASLLIEGETLHCVLEFGKGAEASGRDTLGEVNKQGGSCGGGIRNIPLKPLLESDVALVQERLKGIDVFMVDEISTVSPVMLGWINQRLQQVLGNDLPFGGMGMVLCGDFFQLPPPIPPIPLFKSALHAVLPANHTGKNEPKCNLQSPESIGAMLFTTFHKLELRAIKRTNDANHIELLNMCRNIDVECPITPAVVDRLKKLVLTRTDVANEPGWRFAPIVVTSNIERQSINLAQAVRFGRVHGRPVIRWRLPLTAPSIRGYSETEIALMYQRNESLWGVFVQGAPCYITANLLARAGVANGTTGRLHSLTFDTSALTTAQVDAIVAQIAAARPGDIISIPVVPMSVNVAINAPDTKPWDDRFTVVPGEAVVPTRTDVDRISVMGTSKSVKVSVNAHCYELGFAVTYHKVQGMTLTRLILDINERGFAPELTLQALYVGISRVRHGNDLRVLPPQFGRTFDYLTALTSTRELRCWLAGFGTSVDGAQIQEWDSTLAVAAFTASESVVQSKPTRRKQRNPQRKLNNQPSPSKDTGARQPRAAKQRESVPQRTTTTRKRKQQDTTSSPTLHLQFDSPLVPDWDDPTQSLFASADDISAWMDDFSTPDAIGVGSPTCGLDNLGNTCYINSVLQVTDC